MRSLLRLWCRLTYHDLDHLTFNTLLCRRCGRTWPVAP